VRSTRPLISATASSRIFAWSKASLSPQRRLDLDPVSAVCVYSAGRLGQSGRDCQKGRGVYDAPWVTLPDQSRYQVFGVVDAGLLLNSRRTVSDRLSPGDRKPSGSASMPRNGGLARRTRSIWSFASRTLRTIRSGGNVRAHPRPGQRLLGDQLNQALRGSESDCLVRISEGGEMADHGRCEPVPTGHKGQALDRVSAGQGLHSCRSTAMPPAGPVSGWASGITCLPRPRGVLGGRHRGFPACGLPRRSSPGRGEGGCRRRRTTDCRNRRDSGETVPGSGRR
jgi:hypothetical protein